MPKIKDARILVLDSDGTYRPLKKDELLDPTSDAVFKGIVQHYVFRLPLSLIISQFTGYSDKYIYKHLSFSNTELVKKRYADKGMTTDLIVTFNLNLVNLEMDREGKPSSIIKDNRYHHGIVVDSQIKSKSFKDITALQIRFEKNGLYDEPVVIFTMKNEDGTIEDEKGFKRVRINLAKIKEKYYNGVRLTLVESIAMVFVITSKKEFREYVKDKPYLKEVPDVMERLSMDPDVIGLYNQEEAERQMKEYDLEIAKEEGTKLGKKEGYMNGRTEGYTSGLMDGKTEEKTAIAKSLLKMDIDIKKISKATGLTEKEIKKLSN